MCVVGSQLTRELHVFNPDGTCGFFALHYKASDLGGKVKVEAPDQLCLRGGGVLTDCDSGVGSTAAPASKQGNLSRPVARPRCQIWD